MIYACNWYQNDREGKQNSNSWLNLIFYFEILAGNSKFLHQSHATLQIGHIDLVILHITGIGMIVWMSKTLIHGKL